MQLCFKPVAQHGLFATVVEIPNHEQHAARVWSAFTAETFAFIFENNFILVICRNRWMPISIYLITVSMFFGINIQSKKLLSSQCFSDFAMDEKGRARKASYGSFCAVLRKLQMVYFKFSST